MRTDPVKVEVVLSLAPGVTVRPRTEEPRATTVEELSPILGPAPFAERLFEAAAMTAPLPDILAHDIPVWIGETTPAPEPAVGAARAPEAPTSQR